MLNQIIRNLIPTDTNTSTILLFFTAVIVFYAIFIFYFYRFLAKKNIIELNLNQYNQYSHPILIKIFAAVLYILEYIIFLPILTFFWFSVLAILILLLAKGLEVSTVLLISAALVASTRVTSYINKDLAKDLAKMLPFTLLTIAITTAGFFDISHFFTRISQIPSLFSNIPYYLFFIVTIELIMRILGFFMLTFHSVKATEDETPLENETG